MFNNTYAGKTVLLTGHTGFKGAWLSEWLLRLGARVVGYSLEALPSEPALFAQLGLDARLQAGDDVRGDVRDLERLTALVRRVQPDFVFHLAAQPLVRLSYRDPVGTFTTNVTGSIHVMEAVRLAATRACVVVMVTTDKCYENREWLHAYREEDAMGGHDPYSASKGCAELAVSAYRRSFFSAPLSAEVPIALASARAGNVIGGGDWATDRIVPDCVRALRGGEPILVRNKTSTRPWQHVLEPLSGYLTLGQHLAEALHARDAGALERLCTPFNFGPALASNRTVAELVGEFLCHWPGRWTDGSDPHAPHEAGRLNLTIDKAFHLLRWAPVWSFAETVAATVAWYRAAAELPTEKAAAFAELTRSQIEEYGRKGAADGLAWASADAPGQRSLQ